MTLTYERASSLERPRESSTYIANGSRYQIKLCVPHETQPEKSHDESLSGIGTCHRHCKVCTTACGHRELSIIVGIGEVTEVPVPFKYLSVFLCDEKNTEVLGNWKENKNKPDSIIITEEGSVQFGYSDKSAAEWMWMSSYDGTNHRPRKSFVANASGRKITVSRASGDCVCANIEHRETATTEYEDIKITCGDKSFRVKPKPRTSIIVFSDHIKVTGQLFGENIEEEKWKVDGKTYKPYSYKEIATMTVQSLYPLNIANALTGFLIGFARPR